ncbi:MAG: ABC transporter permease subunit, partial [Candidatus Eremiobacteraeota bacterium]|nr:ABC transporter permease subunit [Candidatus Eremiobacteraeota bacterium]
AKMFQENAICYRAQRAARNNPQSLAQWLMYPLVVLTPGLLVSAWAGDHYDGPSLALTLTAIAHFLYFAARSLFGALGAFAKERDAQTLDVLASTPTGASEVLRGHLWTCLWQRLREFVFLPLVPLFYGSMQAPEWFWLKCVLVTLVVVVTYTCLGLLVSSRCPGHFQATQWGYALLGTTFLGSFLADAVASSSNLAWSQLINPVVTTASQFGFGCQVGSIGGFVVAHLLVALAAYQSCNLSGACQGKVSKLWRPRLPGFENHPLLYRELSFSKPWLYPVLMLATLMGAPLALDWSLEDAATLSLFVHLVYFATRTGNQAARAMAGESERRTLESLLSTRMTPTEIYLGKLAVVSLPLLLELLVFSPVFLFAVGQVRHGTAINGLLLLGLTGVVVSGISAFGLWASTTTMSTSKAGQWVITAGVGAFLGGPIMDLICSVLGPNHNFLGFSLASPVMGIATLLWERSHNEIFWLCSVFYLVVTLVFARLGIRLFQRLGYQTVRA